MARNTYVPLPESVSSSQRACECRGVCSMPEHSTYHWPGMAVNLDRQAPCHPERPLPVELAPEPCASVSRRTLGLSAGAAGSRAVLVPPLHPACRLRGHQRRLVLPLPPPKPIFLSRGPTLPPSPRPHSNLAQHLVQRRRGHLEFRCAFAVDFPPDAFGVCFDHVSDASVEARNVHDIDAAEAQYAVVLLLLRAHDAHEPVALDAAQESVEGKQPEERVVVDGKGNVQL
mmetsp:Transcript_63990/g.133416  ORF Transcript_63990/g.133416 Transcript_63990/m.133416 type:complete len:229 (+) Transcript_63990:301-987(+)